MDLSTRDQDIAESKRLFWKKLPLDIFLYVTAPIVFAFVPKVWDRMPKNSFLRYYEDAKYGIDGDPYWVNKDLNDHPASVEDAKSWKWRVLWSWRNANTWDHEHGVYLDDLVKIEYEGDAYVGNRPLHEGDLAIHAWDKNGQRYWSYYSVHVNEKFPNKCKRSYIGWKLQEGLHNFLKTGNIQGHDTDNVKDLMPAVYSVNPLMGYSKP